MKRVVFARLAPWMGVSYPHPQDAPYACDIAQAAALLDPAREKVTLVDGVVEPFNVNLILQRIVAVNPQVLALTVTTSAEHFATELFNRIKRELPGLYIIGFGQHPHYSPQTFLNESFQIDACVHGEPDATLAELIQETPRNPAEKERVKGIYYWDNELRKTPERPLVTDLDQWPMPRYDLFKNHDYRIVSINFPSFRNLKPGWVLASRGCPYPCTFCSPAIRRSFGKQIRRISPARVADTFELLEKDLGINTIYFADDVFSMDMEWADAICEELIKRENKIQWGVATRVDRLTSELIKKMRAAGLRTVSVGVESGSERVLKDIRKGITLEQIRWALSQFEENGISVNTTVIVGHVDETLDELTQTFSFLKKSTTLFPQLHYLSPYPGTKVAQVFQERLGAVDGISHFNGSPINVSKIPDEVLAGSVQKFYLKYFTSWSFIKKYIRHRVPYALSNPIKEVMLVKDSLAYMLLSGREARTNNTS